MSSKIRTKFTVASVTKYENGSEVKMNVVTQGSEENKELFKWTPSGEISIGLINQEASQKFTPGKEFYVDFISAD